MATLLYGVFVLLIGIRGARDHHEAGIGITYIPSVTLIRGKRLMYTGAAFQRNQLRWQLVGIKAKICNMRGKLDRLKPPVNTGGESRLPNVTVLVSRGVLLCNSQIRLCKQLVWGIWTLQSGSM